MKAECYARVTRELDSLLVAAHGMPLVECEVLLKLSIAGGRMRMSELADAALLSRSGLTRIVDELQSLGLCLRIPAVARGADRTLARKFKPANPEQATPDEPLRFRPRSVGTGQPRALAICSGGMTVIVG